MGKRLVVIGLDCVTPQLLYGEWLDEMPNIKGYVARVAARPAFQTAITMK